eukprot:11160792-Lingulodinium_polyedra.AAC.1
MWWSNRPLVPAAFASARAFHARAQQMACASARACRLRAVATADGRCDRIIAQRFANVAR